MKFLEGKKASLDLEDQISGASRGMDRSSNIFTQELKRGLSIVATIATSSPFIGLFGTIGGIINAFRGMAMTGSAGIGAVAGGIAEALITTAFGIGVAIIALWCYNILNSRVEVYQAEMANTSSEIIDFNNTNYATRIQTIPIPHGQAAIFQVNTTDSTGQNVAVTGSQIRIHPNHDVSVEAQIESSSSENITILIGTDRFTRVFISPLTSGQNNLAFLFQCNSSGLYWPHLGQVRLIVIEDHQLVYSVLLTAQNTELINIILSVILLSVLVIYISMHFWKSNWGAMRLRRLLRRLRSTP